LSFTATVRGQQFTQPGWFQYPERTRSGHEMPEVGQASFGLMSLGAGPAIAEAITPEIESLSRGLEHDPKRIFDWVQGRIRYVHYFGSKKGAQLTLLERSGNSTASFAGGFGDLFRLGEGTHNAIYNAEDGWDVAIGITQDVARGTGLAAMFGGALTRPRTPNAYEALFEAPITGQSRSTHRRSANRYLETQLANDSELADMLNQQLGENVLDHMRSGKKLLNPPDTVWHHPFDNPGSVQLLRKSVHESPSLQPVLHPVGIGGYGNFYGGR
jgi:hypothetical protein